MSKDIFIIDRQYINVLKHADINVSEVIKKAGLSEDIFSHKQPSMNTEEYIHFMEAIKELAQDNELPLRISTVESLETFSPPVFAAYCSRNSLMCMKRLADYKKLIGSLVFKVIENKNNVTLEMTFERNEFKLPEFLVASEFVFTLQIMRNATKNHIIPNEITTIYNLSTAGYKEYFGVTPKIGSKNTMIISMDDALEPFVSWNDSMWEYFEPELKRRLTELNSDDSYITRVNTALTELLPGGEAGIEEVAKKIGYCDCNSFIRAFNSWTGISISQYKKEILKKRVC